MTMDLLEKAPVKCACIKQAVLAYRSPRHEEDEYKPKCDKAVNGSRTVSDALPAIVCRGGRVGMPPWPCCASYVAS
jgi:hypothetical protein